MLDPIRLMTLAQVEDRGGVVAAANALHLTPSAVSQQLRHLERSADVSLLDRSGRQVRLTEAGRRLADRGRRIAQEVVLAGDDLAPWLSASERTVTIAAFQTVLGQVLAPLIASGRLEQAGLTIRVVEVEGPRAEEALHAGQVDLVMTEELLGTDPASPRPGRDLVTRLVMDDRYRLVVPTAWGLRDEADAIRSALVDRPWISQADDTVGGAMLVDLTHRWGFSAHVVHVCYEYTSAVALVAAGAGATLAPHLALPLTALDSPEQRSPVQVLEATPDLGARRLRALSRPARRIDPALQTLLSLLADQATRTGLVVR